MKKQKILFFGDLFNNTGHYFKYVKVLFYFFKLGYTKGVPLLSTGIQKGKALDLRAEPLCSIKLCRVAPGF